MAYYLKAGRQATGFRSLANGRTAGFVNGFFMRSRRVTRFAAARASIANQGVHVKASVANRLRRRDLARTRRLNVTLTAQERIKASLATARKRHDREILRDLLRDGRLRGARVRKAVRASAALVQTGRVVVLCAVTRINLSLALVIRPNCARLMCAIKGTGAFGRIYLLGFKVFVVFFFGDSGRLFCYLVVFEFIEGAAFRVFRGFFYIRIFEVLFWLVLILSFVFLPNKR